MRVVIDTIVFISSFITPGTLSKIIDLWKKGRITLCLSKPIVEEYLEVLKQLGLEDEQMVDEILLLFGRGFNSIFTAKTSNFQIFEENPHDDKFFQCAVALKARYIISGDKAILAIDDYVGIKVVTPKQFVDLMDA
ncbi:MAG: putative toxin-antitoxin system toxin component, PIN family [Deltaproteobacteria bacterium]|nr:putative toxin-antitoxin system toxin component, PIN family [Deltaproteobacteria bacterium]